MIQAKDNFTLPVVPQCLSLYCTDTSYVFLSKLGGDKIQLAHHMIMRIVIVGRGESAEGFAAQK